MVRVKETILLDHWFEPESQRNTKFAFIDSKVIRWFDTWIKWFFLCQSLVEGSSELLHYAVSNITANDKGEKWMNYMPPIPFRGSGYHRLVTTLYHQNEKISVSPLDPVSLRDRTFTSKAYLANNEKVLTPAAFCFSQVIFYIYSNLIQSSFWPLFKGVVVESIAPYLKWTVTFRLVLKVLTIQSRLIN